MQPNNSLDGHILSVLRQSLRTVLPDLSEEQLVLDRDLAELGFNSLDRADVITMTMEALGVEVPVVQFLGVKTIRELTQLFARQSRR
ncbi:MAG: phosphopantetheine-binding protein [Myxococcota bacterium]